MTTHEDPLKKRAEPDPEPGAIDDARSGAKSAAVIKAHLREEKLGHEINSLGTLASELVQFMKEEWPKVIEALERRAAGDLSIDTKEFQRQVRDYEIRLYKHIEPLIKDLRENPFKFEDAAEAKEYGRLKFDVQQALHDGIKLYFYYNALETIERGKPIADGFGLSFAGAFLDKGFYSELPRELWAEVPTAMARACRTDELTIEGGPGDKSWSRDQIMSFFLTGKRLDPTLGTGIQVDQRPLSQVMTDLFQALVVVQGLNVSAGTHVSISPEVRDYRLPSCAPADLAEMLKNGVRAVGERWPDMRGGEIFLNADRDGPFVAMVYRDNAAGLPQGMAERLRDAISGDRAYMGGDSTHGTMGQGTQVMVENFRRMGSFDFVTKTAGTDGGVRTISSLRDDEAARWAELVPATGTVFVMRLPLDLRAAS